nr:hypothetical protein [Kofleriaceae bacterium]
MSSATRTAAPESVLSADQLTTVSGGDGTQALFTSIVPGTVPRHTYGLVSEVFHLPGGQFEQADALLQQFNAPTAAALYQGGNDPTAELGTVSRPGAQDLAGTEVAGFPLDHGGNVTLMHGDGYIRNTTINGEHPLEGSITRNLVVDLREGGGFQVMTLGRGEGGAELPSQLGGAVGSLVDSALSLMPASLASSIVAGPDPQPGTFEQLGASAAQNVSHIINPELGLAAFSRLDQAMLAEARGVDNPNLAEPGGRLAELAISATAAGNTVLSALGLNDPAPVADPQQQLAYDVAQQLNEAGPVDGYFTISGVTPGVYHHGPQGTTYYEAGADGKPVVAPVDEFAGVDAAIAQQAADDAGATRGLDAAPADAAAVDAAMPELPPLPELTGDLPSELVAPADAAPADGAPADAAPADAAPADAGTWGDLAAAGPIEAAPAEASDATS